MLLDEIAVLVECPTCGARPRAWCHVAGKTNTRSKKLHEARLAPFRAAFAAGEKWQSQTRAIPVVHDPDPTGAQRAAEKLSHAAAVVRGHFAREWRYYVSYAVSLLVLLAAVYVVERFWPGLLAEAWAATWRYLLIMVGAYSAFFLFIELVLRPLPPPHNLDDIYGNCRVCGASKDEPCLTNEEMAARNDTKEITA